MAHNGCKPARSRPAPGFAARLAPSRLATPRRAVDRHGIAAGAALQGGDHRLSLRFGRLLGNGDGGCAFRATPSAAICSPASWACSSPSDRPSASARLTAFRIFSSLAYAAVLTLLVPATCSRLAPGKLSLAAQAVPLRPGRRGLPRLDALSAQRPSCRGVHVAVRLLDAGVPQRSAALGAPWRLSCWPDWRPGLPTTPEPSTSFPHCSRR